MTSFNNNNNNNNIGQILKKLQQCFKIQNCGSRHLNFCIINITDVFLLVVVTFPLNLVIIGRIVKKLQTFFAI